MSTHIVEINGDQDFNNLYKIIQEGLPDSIFVVRIELNVSFLMPWQILMIVVFVIHHEREGELEVEINVNLNQLQVLKYLVAIGLIDFCNANRIESKTIESIPSYSAMPIKRLTARRMNEYIDATQAYFQSLFPQKDLSMLKSSLAELLNNVYDHAQSDIDAYVFAQYYPTKGEIRMAVADLGIGIPVSVNRYMEKIGQKPLSVIEAIRWALQENNSTQSTPQNRGKGLNNIMSFMGATRNHWFIRSEQGITRVTHRNGNPMTYFFGSMPHFFGTIIELTIREDSLESISEDAFFDWDNPEW